MEFIQGSSAGRVRILLAEVRHTDDLRSIRLEALKNHPDAFAADSDHDRETDWAARISNPRGAIFLAYAGRTPVGMTGILRGASSKTQHSAQIWGVYVSPAFRRKGVAKALMESALAWGEKQGVRIARLAVTTSNKPAFSLYSALGFEPYGEEPWALNVDGRSYNELLLAKRI